MEQVFYGVSADVATSKSYEAKTVLTKLGITEFDKKMGTLSGGQKKRVAIASALLRPCEVLVLDEPTNHLDNEMIEWLESYLIKYTGAIVMVTHDRYFLDRIANRIVEIENGSLVRISRQLLQISRTEGTARGNGDRERAEKADSLQKRT